MISVNPVSLTGGNQTKVEINERFQIQTCIFYDGERQEYEPKAVKLVC